jgi:hypothetical protein
MRPGRMSLRRQGRMIVTVLWLPPRRNTLSLEKTSSVLAR